MKVKIKFPKNIPHGITYFGVVAALTATTLNRQKQNKLIEENKVLREDYKVMKQDVQELKGISNNNSNKLDKLQESVNNVSDNVNQVKNSLDKNNYLENNLFSFEDIKALFNNYLDYYSASGHSFDLAHQIIIMNILTYLFLLSLLLSYVSGLYANYLIENFNLRTRFPKLCKILEYRLTYQRYYFKYIFTLALLALLYNLIIHIYMCFNISNPFIPKTKYIA